MSYLNEYQKWLQFEGLEESLKVQLKQMSEDEKEDAFYKEIQFGTAGMRGVVGPGINRMNQYTVTKANLGFAKYLLTHEEDAKSKGVVIAHDNRHMSKEFAYHSACVLATKGIKTYLFDTLKPTPELSFAVRHLDAAGGIVITASHNPSEYNGYKIYDSRGCQYVPAMGEIVINYVSEVDDVFTFELGQDCDSLITYIGEEIDNAYMEKLKEIRLRKDVDASKMKIVFTPLHGTSAVLGERVLNEFGYNYQCVASQMVPDPDFTTVNSPNPEDKEAFKVAIEFANENGGDLIIATDPDADRLGIAVKNGDDYVLLTGNETGALLINYILTTRQEFSTLPKHGVIYDTIVTSSLGRSIGFNFGMENVQTLTGFKFIGEQAYLIEDTEKEFVFGYEESYGYVIKDFVRDKDSLQAIILASEAAAYYFNQGISLLDKLEEIYATYGYYTSETVNIKLEGKAGEERIKRILSTFREEKIDSVNGLNVSIKEDYLNSIIEKNGEVKALTLPKSNVLKFTLEDGSWFVLRPSGTEPKLKVYFEVKGNSKENGLELLEQVKKDVLERVEKI